MKIKTPNDKQLLQEVLMILSKNLSPTQLLRFIATYNLGQGDYLQFKDQEFSSETVESLSAKIDSNNNTESINNYTNVQYNCDIDELKISWSQAEIKKSNPVSPGIILDYDIEDNVIGIEIFNASEKIKNLQ
jgi:uncharacterized protein YuzE